MGLRPKTARRFALIAGLLIVVIIGGLAVLTVPRWQRGRQIESFKREGLAAHEAGRHHEAVPLLGRHMRAVGEENTAPEVLLGLARSRAELEARRDNHITIAITRYRAYLRLVPDDITARRELLSLLVRAERWGEAKDLAERINPQDPDAPAPADLQPIRDELAARINLDPADPRAETLRGMLLGAQPPAFEDVWESYEYFLRVVRDVDRAEAIADAYLDGFPDELGAGAIRAIQPVLSDPSDPQSRLVPRPTAEIVIDLSALFDLDDDVQTPGSVQIFDKNLAWVVAGYFDRIGRANLGAEILSQSLNGADKFKNMNALARRLFWSGQNEALFALGTGEDSRSLMSDTIGYQALAALETGDTERAGELERELEAISYNYKAQAWSGMLLAKKAYDAGDLPAARAAINEAVERHEDEPTFRLLLGDVQNALGFTNEAKTAWEQASISAGSTPWSPPVVRRISALLESDSVLQARALLMATLDRPGFGTDVGLRMLQTRVDALAARQGLIAQREIIAASMNAESLRSVLIENGLETPEIDLALASMYGVLGEPEVAARALARVLELDDAARFMFEVLEIDQRYGLGLASSLGRPELPETIDDPAAALRLTLTYTDSALRENSYSATDSRAVREERIERSMALIDAGLRNADSGERAAWLLTRARYMDVFKQDEAGTAWEAAIAADPENLSVLGLAVWSEALGRDQAFVESTLERIRVLTSNQGRTLPTSLRLARARAVFGKEPTRAKRDEAIAIVRSVIAAEPENNKARLLLADMLVTVPPKSESEGQSAVAITPDIAGAIEQYQSVAGRIGGTQAVGYYFAIIDLASRSGDRDRAQRAIRDLMSVWNERPESVTRLAEAMRDLGDREAAARMIKDYFDTTSGKQRVVMGFMLIEIYEMMDASAESVGVIDQLASEGSLTRTDLTKLVFRMAQRGMDDRVDSILSDPERFGLEPSDAAGIRAQLIVQSRPLDEAIQALDTMVDSDVTNVEVWRVLIDALLDADRTDDANERIDRALEAHPGDEQIAFLRARASGDLDAMARLTLASSGAPAAVAEDLERALDEVQSFERDRAGMSDAEQISALRSLTARFPRLAPVLNYTIVEREALGEDLGELASDAFAAARAFPKEPALLVTATRVSLATGAYEDAAAFAATWRGLVTGSRIEPDLYAAEAAQQLGRDARAIALVEPYMEDALARPGEPFNTAALVIYGASQMRSGLGTETRSRYGPIAARDPEFRASVWVPLGSRWAGSSRESYEWLDAAEQWGMIGREKVIAQGWIDAAERFVDRRSDMLERAVASTDRAVEADPDDAEAHAQRAGVLRLMGLMASATGQDSGRDWHTEAVASYREADRLDPANLNMLFQAARTAEDAGRYADAERLFSQLLERPGCTGLFAAAVRNNIAMSMVRQGETDRERLGLALQLVEAALGERQLPTFVSTRGWVRLLMGDRAGAVEDFRRFTQGNPGNALGWAGLALAERGEGPAPGAVAVANWRRAIELGLDERFAFELGSRAGFASE
jgi:tetratricopeptide (TPR) repeat protein